MPLSPSNRKPVTSTERRFDAASSPLTRQGGFSLIELIIFIVIVSVAVAGVLAVYNQAIRGSADPMVRKQAVAIAESLLAEVLMQPFTYCDPQDAVNTSAIPPTSTAQCTGGAGASEDNGGSALGPKPAGETRFNAINPFNNVADYNNYAMPSGPCTGICSLDGGGAAIAALSAYTANVTVIRAGATFGLATDAVLRVDVVVTGRGETITLTSYRFRYAPNATG
jgi:MSHA pilin protein MshD